MNKTLITRFVRCNHHFQNSLKPPEVAGRLSLAEYSVTPDDESAYDNAPWTVDTYKALMESDKPACTTYSNKQPSEGGGTGPTTKVKPDESFPPCTSETSANDTHDRFPTHRHLSNSDSGIGSLRGDSMTKEDFDVMNSKIEGCLTDLTPSKLDMLEGKIESPQRKRIQSKRRRDSAIRTKKTRSGAMNALSKY